MSLDPWDGTAPPSLGVKIPQKLHGFRWAENRPRNFADFSRWWFPIFFVFTPIPGEMIEFDEHIFQMGWFNHQLFLLLSIESSVKKTCCIVKSMQQQLWTHHMDVSENSGTPKSSILIRVFHYKPSILGYHYFRKHPYPKIWTLDFRGTWQPEHSWTLEGVESVGRGSSNFRLRKNGWNFMELLMMLMVHWNVQNIQKPCKYYQINYSDRMVGWISFLNKYLSASG